MGGGAGMYGPGGYGGAPGGYGYMDHGAGGPPPYAVSQLRVKWRRYFRTSCSLVLGVLICCPFLLL